MLVTAAGIELEPGFVLPDTASLKCITKAAQRIRNTESHVIIAYRDEQEVGVAFVDDRQRLLDQKQTNGWRVNWSWKLSPKKWTRCRFQGNTLIGLYTNRTAIRPDLTGFPSLRELECVDTGLKRLDVSKNVALVALCCNSNLLQELDVSANICLVKLTCDTNELTGLDVANNRALRVLECGRNQLRELDLSGNPALQTLNCGRNRLSALDLTVNQTLSALYCHMNPLQELIVTECVALETLVVHSTALTRLKASGCIALEKLHTSNTPLEDVWLSKHLLWLSKHLQEHRNWKNTISSKRVHFV